MGIKVFEIRWFDNSNYDIEYDIPKCTKVRASSYKAAIRNFLGLKGMKTKFIWSVDEES